MSAYEILFNEGFLDKYAYVIKVHDSCLSLPLDRRGVALVSSRAWGCKVLRDELTRLASKYAEVRSEQFGLYDNFIHFFFNYSVLVYSSQTHID